jgi:hypothetical protein
LATAIFSIILLPVSVYDTAEELRAVEPALARRLTPRLEYRWDPAR